MSKESAIALIDSAASKTTLFIGDFILDEYHYVTPLGKSPKEHLIAARYEREESFKGGIYAAAKHAESFCKSVFTCAGNTYVVKRRFVDENQVRKLFEVHYQHPSFKEEGQQSFDMYDSVVVADFGHGCMTAELIDRATKQSRFLAVNAQTNSANIGFNLITKYSRADYIVIDEPEARLAAGDRDGHIEDVILKLAHGRCNKFVVTLGYRGAIGYDGSFHRSPAFANLAVDTMGAGDAFFAVTAPMAKDAEMDDLLLIGNAAGALKCRIVGHRSSVTKEALLAYLHETH